VGLPRICALAALAAAATAGAGLASGATPTTSAAVSPAPNARGWSNRAVTVALTASEPAGPGVAAVTYAASGALTLAPTRIAGSSAQVTVAREGVTTLAYGATDVAGAVEPSKRLVLRLDGTPPRVTCSAGPRRLVPSGRLVPVRVVVSVSDGGSGVAGFALAGVSPAADASGWDSGTPDTGGLVRAVPGRRYSLSYRALDVAGNATGCTATVTVARR
jgi:hypothetical protein